MVRHLRPTPKPLDETSVVRRFKASLGGVYANRFFKGVTGLEFEDSSVQYKCDDCPFMWDTAHLVRTHRQRDHPNEKKVQLKLNGKPNPNTTLEPELLIDLEPPASREPELVPEPAGGGKEIATISSATVTRQRQPDPKRLDPEWMFDQAGETQVMHAHQLMDFLLHSRNEARRDLLLALNENERLKRVIAHLEKVGRQVHLLTTMFTIGPEKEGEDSASQST